MYSLADAVERKKSAERPETVVISIINSVEMERDAPFDLPREGSDGFDPRGLAVPRELDLAQFPRGFPRFDECVERLLVTSGSGPVCERRRRRGDS